MRDDSPNSDDPRVLRIVGELTIFRAAELKQAMLERPDLQEIDLSGVTDMDSAGLQLLMFAKKMALAQQRDLRLVGHSAAVAEVFELLNVTDYFDHPLVVGNRAGGAR